VRIVMQTRRGKSNALASGFAVARGHSDDITPVRRLGNRFLNGLVDLVYRTRYTNLRYGYNAFRRSCPHDMPLVQPRHGGQAEQARQPQRPRQPGCPPARPGWSGGRRHRRGPGCSQRTTDPATSHARRLPVWPACVWAALRRTDRPRLARGTCQSTARDSVLALPSDILSDAL
jgi:hypothetical protein